MKTLDSDMARKIESVLARVREPESNLTIAELGIIEKFRFNERRRALYIFANTYSSHKGCCFLITKLLESETLTRLKNELQKEFPDLAIQFA